MKNLSFLILLSACSHMSVGSTEISYPTTADVDPVVVEQAIQLASLETGKDARPDEIRFSYTPLFCSQNLNNRGELSGGVCRGLTRRRLVLVQLKSGCLARSSLTHELLHVAGLVEHNEKFKALVKKINARLEHGGCR
jgi:hypothetical protein